MKKKLLLFVVALSTTLLSAQNITDGLRYSLEDSNGTARYQGMSGAFGALGGDFSAMRINPAGSAVFLNSAASVSFSINDIENSTTFNSSQQKRIDTDVDLNQLGGVFVIDIKKEGNAFNKITIGLNYDVSRNFSNQITARGSSSSSIANFFAAQAEGIPLELLQLQNGETIGSLYRYLGQTEGTAAQNALLGYQAFIIDPTDPDNINNTNYLSNVAVGEVNQRYTKLSEGANSKFTVNVGTQIEENYYVGINLNSHSIDYRESTYSFESNSLAGSSVTSIGFENNLAVVAFKSTVPSTIINTKGVIYSAPSTPDFINLLPNKEAIPAATIPRGPTQLINIFSFVFSFEFVVLKNTANGLITKITIPNNNAVFQLYSNIISSILILAANKINRIEISSTLIDSLKYKSSFIFSSLLFPKTIPITTTASKPDSCAKISDSTKTNKTVDNETTFNK